MGRGEGDGPGDGVTHCRLVRSKLKVIEGTWLSVARFTSVPDTLNASLDNYKHAEHLMPGEERVEAAIGRLNLSANNLQPALAATTPGALLGVWADQNISTVDTADGNAGTPIHQTFLCNGSPGGCGSTGVRSRDSRIVWWA